MITGDHAQPAEFAPPPAVVERGEWHHRLLNGFDYPLPGSMPLYPVDHMVELNFIKPALAPVLSASRRYNRRLFDFVLKRQIAVSGRRPAARRGRVRNPRLLRAPRRRLINAASCNRFN